MRSSPTSGAEHVTTTVKVCLRDTQREAGARDRERDRESERKHSFIPPTWSDVQNGRTWRTCCASATQTAVSSIRFQLDLTMPLLPDTYMYDTPSSSPPPPPLQSQQHASKLFLPQRPLFVLVSLLLRVETSTSNAIGHCPAN